MLTLHAATRRVSLLLLFLAAAPGSRTHAAPVDYPSEIQPIFTASCGNGFCHLDRETSGVELTTYEKTMASFGLLYDQNIVVPFASAHSPLWLKVASADPENGERMPPPPAPSPLTAEEIDLIARWIDEGARAATTSSSRGDVDRNGRIDISDPIRVLGFLFLGSPDPPCLPAANANGDLGIDLSDAVFLLAYLFLGGPGPPYLTPDEARSCLPANSPPSGRPLGTVIGRVGIPLELEISASDAEGDSLRYFLEAGPAGLTIDPLTGAGMWTPQEGQAGDHRVRVRVEEASGEHLSSVVTGLIRILEGNSAPAVAPLGSRFGREGVVLQFSVSATDADGNGLAFTLLQGPGGSTVAADTGVFGWLPPVGSAGEHDVRIRVADDGVPPRVTETAGKLVILPAGAPINTAPTLPALDVYRTYAGQQISRRAGAVDAEGDSLTYTADGDLPAGATLDPTTGVLSWVPSPAQVGTHYLPFTVTDSGVPPESASDIFIFRIEPTHPCDVIECDPATGCSHDVKPITVDCCTPQSAVRVPEPAAECPEGRVLHVGRNIRGFGRLQNCDKLRVSAFAQGGESVTLHLEARCVNAQREATVDVQLETLDEHLVNRQRLVFLQQRSDGFAQRLSLNLAVDTILPHSNMEGAEANLRVTLTDFDGVVVQENLRLILTLLPLPDLPEPDAQDVPAGESGCVGCHRPVGPTGVRHGIEDAHPWHPLTCTDCHGGDASANTRLEAHVFPPFGDPTFLRNLTADQLDVTDRDYLLFINPGDQRVARRGCGSSNPASAGTGCHQALVDKLPLLIMSNAAGHYAAPRFLAGAQGKGAEHAATDVVDLNYDPGTAPPGAVPSLEALREPDPLASRATVSSCMDVYLPKACPTCHLADFGRNNAVANYRSSGCTACHMVYDDDGLSRSDDPALGKDFPPHPAKHQLTTAIPTEQCSHCHYESGRIGLSYRGIREGGFAAAQTPPNAVPLGREIHGHDANHYLVDEDDTNDVDETPPDVHHAAGLVCADCHVGDDIHGDGNLYSSSRDQVGIRCEDCHGSVRAEVTESPGDGKFKTSRGSALTRLRRTPDNRILLRLLTQDRELEVPQVHRILASGENQAMTEAMGVHESGFAHTDKLECYTCHTSWRQTCFGCHVTIDDTRPAINYTTGRSTQGAITTRRDEYALDFFALGVNQRGKISPLAPGMSLYLSYIDSSGVKRFEDRARTSSEGRTGFGWSPFYHHTVSRVPQNCDTCHPVAPGAGPDNAARLRETYGFGGGRFVLRDGDGIERDQGAFLDDNGALQVEFPHPGTGPVPTNVRDRALSVPVIPHPRQ